MKSRMTAVCLVAAALWVFPAWGLSGQQKSGAEAKSAPTQQAPLKMQAYLGVGVEAVPSALEKQLPTLNNQGVLIAEVAKDSPAQHAGLKPYDILVSYDDHQLYSPEQLVKLVQNDKPGRQVSLGVVSAGKSEKIKATLGEHHPTEVSSHHPAMSIIPDESRFFTVRPQQESSWDAFDSLNLTRLDDKTFKAEISYRAKDGEIKRHSFKGTRHEISAAIEKEKDMPAAEREESAAGPGYASPGPRNRVSRQVFVSFQPGHSRP